MVLGAGYTHYNLVCYGSTNFDFRGIAHAKTVFNAFQNKHVLLIWKEILIEVLQPRAVFLFCLYLLYAANYIRSSGELISNYFIFLHMVTSGTRGSNPSLKFANNKLKCIGVVERSKNQCLAKMGICTAGPIGDLTNIRF